MNEESDTEKPLSRTKKKQLAKQVEQLAHLLTELPDNQFRQLELSAELAEEAELARATRGRGSHKRQVKHLAGLLRKQEAELLQIQEQLQRLDQVARGEKREFHLLEKLRDRLCSKDSFDDAFNEMLELYPQIDRKAIARLARSVHEHADKRAFREIFRRLRDVD
jgi:ribosome-associated protein